jgi:hypothetical protein
LLYLRLGRIAGRSRKVTTSGRAVLDTSAVGAHGVPTPRGIEFASARIAAVVKAVGAGTAIDNGVKQGPRYHGWSSRSGPGGGG